MLNTIRTIPAQVQQPEQIQNETNVEEMMNNLTRQLKAPLEEAMQSTLVPKLEQLVSVSTQNVEMSNKVRKGISGLDGDMLRSM
jgi:biotin-(acetyl-CoA carboxylase) ligase